MKLLAIVLPATVNKVRNNPFAVVKLNPKLKINLPKLPPLP
jgi:hypothetical protein